MSVIVLYQADNNYLFLVMFRRIAVNKSQTFLDRLVANEV